MTLAVTDTQQIIVDALNGRNIAAADDAFTPIATSISTVDQNGTSR
jgi:hypothetical protein